MPPQLRVTNPKARKRAPGAAVLRGKLVFMPPCSSRPVASVTHAQADDGRVEEEDESNEASWDTALDALADGIITSAKAMFLLP